MADDVFTTLAGLRQQIVQATMLLSHPRAVSGAKPRASMAIADLAVKVVDRATAEIRRLHDELARQRAEPDEEILT